MHLIKIINCNIENINAVFTSHGIGMKKVLISEKETESSITQIAMTYLIAGDQVKCHNHPTMDEHFFIVEGNGVITINGINIPFRKGSFVVVPVNKKHSLKAETDIDILNVGVEL